MYRLRPTNQPSGTYFFVVPLTRSITKITPTMMPNLGWMMKMIYYLWSHLLLVTMTQIHPNDEIQVSGETETSSGICASNVGNALPTRASVCKQNTRSCQSTTSSRTNSITITTNSDIHLNADTTSAIETRHDVLLTSPPPFEGCFKSSHSNPTPRKLKRLKFLSPEC